MQSFKIDIFLFKQFRTKIRHVIIRTTQHIKKEKFLDGKALKA